MTTQRTLRAVAAVSLSALLLPAAGQAYADAPAPSAPKNCAVGALCAYSGTDYTGAATVIKGDNRDLMHTRALQRVKSLYNNGRYDVVVWNRKDFKGRSIEIPRYRGEKMLAADFGHSVVSDKWEVGHR